MALFKLIYSDYLKHKKYGGSFLVIIFLTQGFWAQVQYRIASSIYSNVHFPVLRQLLLFILLICQKLIEIITGISIPASVKIGHSFYIGHFGGIIISPQAVIGVNCNISQSVTIGISGAENYRGVPVIGDEVYIGANSVIAGKITIGNNVLIGACSLVNRSVLDNNVVVGVPAVVVSTKGSKGYI